MGNLWVQNIEPAFVASVLISFVYLFSLDKEGSDPAFWLSLGRSSCLIAKELSELVGSAHFKSRLGSAHEEPADLFDDALLCSTEAREPFAGLSASLSFLLGDSVQISGHLDV